MTMKGKIASWGLLCLAWAASASAGVKDVRDQIEASMLVTGYVYIAPSGAVDRLELDQPDKLPPAVHNVVSQAGPTWVFDPVMVDGVARKAKARMSLRVVATRHSEDNYEVTLRSAYFGEEAMSADERIEHMGASTVRSRELRPPLFPQQAAEMRARGTVYLIVKVGRDGVVQDAFPEQVNLQVIGREKQMDAMRAMFTRSAVNGAKRWTFHPPTEGPEATRPFWLVRVPVDYAMLEDKKPGYGQWDAYVPGPQAKHPWAEDASAPSEAPDAMIAGGLYPVGKGLRLRTPLGG